MKRSQVVILLAGGATLAVMTAYSERGDCSSDAANSQAAQCSSSGGSHAGSGSSSQAFSSSTSRGGFGATGAAHGSGGA